MGKPVDPRDQLYRRIDVNAVTHCWNWTGSLTVKGYGQFKNKKFGPNLMAASRASWLIHNGPISKGLFVCHKCDNRKCVNPDHLFLGTQKQNMEDCVAKVRINRGERRPQSKLTELDVREMRGLRRLGWSWEKLMVKYDVSKNCVRSATIGQTWAHIDTPVPTERFPSGRRKDG